MPLNTPGLNSDLQALFEAPPEGFAPCAQEWADAMQSYAAAIIPASTTVVAAAAVLNTALATAFQAGAADPTGAAIAPLMETAFVTFATTIGTGMAPTFVATPPPLPVGWATALAGTPPETHAEAASKYSNLIDTWMRTGTAVPAAGGPAVPWS